MKKVLLSVLAVVLIAGVGLFLSNRDVASGGSILFKQHKYWSGGGRGVGKDSSRITTKTTKTYIDTILVDGRAVQMAVLIEGTMTAGIDTLPYAMLRGLHNGSARVILHDPVTGDSVAMAVDTSDGTVFTMDVTLNTWTLDDSLQITWGQADDGDADSLEAAQLRTIQTLAK